MLMPCFRCLTDPLSCQSVGLSSGKLNQVVYTSTHLKVYFFAILPFDSPKEREGCSLIWAIKVYTASKGYGFLRHSGQK